MSAAPQSTHSRLWGLLARRRADRSRDQGGVGTEPELPRDEAEVPPGAEPAGLSRADQLVVVVLTGVQLILVFDFSLVTVALPKIQTGLAFSHASLQWVVTAYTLTYGGFLLVGGRVADYYGRRRVFVASVLGFLLASVVAGLAVSRLMLVGARGLQGVMAAAAAPAALSLLTTRFTNRPRRQRALAIYGAVAAIGFPVGSLVGGIVTSVAGWRAVFFVNVPIGLALVAAAGITLPPDRLPPRRGSFSLISAVFATCGVGALILGFATAAAGHTSRVVGYLLLSAVLVSIFIATERRTDLPLVPRGAAAGRAFLGSASALALASATDGGVVYLTVLRLEQVLGYSAIQAGLFFLLPGIAAVSGGFAAAGLMARVGSRRTLMTGLWFEGAGVILLAEMPFGGNALTLLAGNALDAFGLVIAVVAATVTLTSETRAGDQGVAGGLVNASTQLGIALGIALFVAAAASAVSHDAGLANVAVGATHATEGFRRAMASGVGLVALGTVGVLIIPGHPGARQAV